MLAVSTTCAGSTRHAAPRVVGGDRGTRRRQPEGMRLVPQRARIGERRQQVRRIGQIDPCRIRLGEIDDRLAARAHRRERPRQRFVSACGGRRSESILYPGSGEPGYPIRDRSRIPDPRSPIPDPSGSRETIYRVTSMRAMVSPSSTRVGHVDARRDLAEHGEVVVEARVVEQVDEELRVAGVAAARRQADGPARVPTQPELVAHERAVAGVLVRSGTAALQDEAGSHAPEAEPVVIPLLARAAAKRAAVAGASSVNSLISMTPPFRHRHPDARRRRRGRWASARRPRPGSPAARGEGLRRRRALPWPHGLQRGGALGGDDRVAVAEAGTQRRRLRRRAELPQAHQQSPREGRATCRAFRR